jgi:hypothetical protein
VYCLCPSVFCSAHPFSSLIHRRHIKPTAQANNRGVCHAQQHRPMIALRDLDYALSLFPALPHATFNRAHVHLILADVWSALVDIRTEQRVNASAYLGMLCQCAFNRQHPTKSQSNKSFVFTHKNELSVSATFSHSQR